MDKYTIPLLDELRSVGDYIKLYEQKDKRLIMDDMRYMFLVSAYVLKGDYEKGKKVLEDRFGKPSLRKRYDLAFQYLDRF